MTFDQYIQNPMGKRNSVYSARDMYRKMYTEKWGAIKLRENGLIIYTLYVDKEDYYVHFKIPSEVVPKFYYDTIIKFSPPANQKAVLMERTLSNYEVQFYSNDPSFVFTFAHAFRKHGMLIKDLESKMSKIAIKEKAAERNPDDQVGYVKSIYFAYLEMRQLNLFAKVRWDGKAKSYSKSVWKDTVTHADDKVHDRQEKGNAIAKKERRMKNAHSSVQQHRQTSQHSNSAFKSPNILNFGHFKSTINKNISGIKKSIGHFKKGK